MSAFGQSLANRVYRDTTVRAYSKWETFCHIARMLDAVGMVYVGAITSNSVTSSYLSGFPNPVDPASSTFTPTGVSWPIIAVFDYPTSESFTVDTVAYKPCVTVIFYPWFDNSTYANANYEGTSILVEHSIRPAAANFAASDLRNFNNLTGFTVARGWSNNYSSNNYFTARQGAFVTIASWKPHVSFVGTYLTQNIVIRHSFAYLGKGGLVLSLGSNDNLQDRVGCYDYLNCGFLFGGARIPNRQYAPMSDLYLPAINPVFPMYFSTTDGRWRTGTYGGPGVKYATWIWPMSHALASAVANSEPVYMVLANLENLDRPAYPTYHPDTKPSPLNLSGNGRSILGRVITMPGFGYNNNGNLYCPYNVDWGSAPGSPLPNGYAAKWEDMFSCPNVRFADTVTPIGVYQDPDSLDYWWLHWWGAFNCGIAFIANSLTQISTFPSRTYNTPTTYPITLTSGGYAGPYAPLAQPVSGNVIVPALLSGAVVSQWAQVASQNYSDVSATSGDNALTYRFNFPTGVDPWDEWFVTFSAYVRGGTENSGGTYLAFEVQDAAGQGWWSALTLLSAGANAGHASYTYSNRGTFRIPCGVDTNATLQFRFRMYTSGSPSLTARVGDVTISRKRLV